MFTASGRDHSRERETAAYDHTGVCSAQLRTNPPAAPYPKRDHDFDNHPYRGSIGIMENEMEATIMGLYPGNLTVM